MTLVLIDICGMKDRWRSEGADGVKRVFTLFEQRIDRALADCNLTATGGIQSDAAALVFPSPKQAVVFGCELFVKTFLGCGKEPGDRIWLRGVIKDSEISASSLVGRRPLNEASDVVARDLHEDLMAAINVEQAGFKGNRLVIEKTCVTKDLDRALRIELGEGGHLRRFSQLEFSQPPAEAYGDWLDVLWMIPNPLQAWHEGKHVIARWPTCFDGPPALTVSFARQQAQASYSMSAELWSLQRA